MTGISVGGFGLLLLIGAAWASGWCASRSKAVGAWVGLLVVYTVLMFA